jgi:hypothetical protein
MKSYAFAALAAVASAELVLTDGPETTIPEATYGSVKSNGSLGETWIEDSSGESVAIWLWAQWENKVTGQHLDSGMVVQNYAQWTSTTEAGKFDGFTCAATYEKSNGTTSNVTVKNIANSDSLTNADGKQNGKAWSAIGTAATDYDWFEKETDSAFTNEFYGRTY